MSSPLKSLNFDWNKSGYPPRYWQDLRKTYRNSMLALSITGSAFVSLLWGVVYWSVEPVHAAIAGAFFVFFGVFGTSASIYTTRNCVRVFPYFERSVGPTNTYGHGHALAAALVQLDALAEALGVTPLSRFGFNDDLRGEELIWHSPAQGLKTIEVLMMELRDQRENAPFKHVYRDLRRWQRALKKASRENVGFCILLMYGNMTSGHEWSIRKGTAF